MAVITILITLISWLSSLNISGNNIIDVFLKRFWIIQNTANMDFHFQPN